MASACAAQGGRVPHLSAERCDGADKAISRTLRFDRQDRGGKAQRSLPHAIQPADGFLKVCRAIGAVQLVHVENQMGRTTAIDHHISLERLIHVHVADLLGAVGDDPQPPILYS